MQLFILIFLLTAIILQIVLFVILWDKQFLKLMNAISHRKKSQFAINILESYNKLTSIKWYTDMMLQGEFGKVNLSQKQFLHQIAIDCDWTLKYLQSASKNLKVKNAAEEASLRQSMRTSELKKS